ncbi:MAG: hypothetical protein ACI4O7_05660 [Aristaeellaceae bacterium]
MDGILSLIVMCVFVHYGLPGAKSQGRTSAAAGYWCHFEQNFVSLGQTGLTSSESMIE